MEGERKTWGEQEVEKNKTMNHQLAIKEERERITQRKGTMERNYMLRFQREESTNIGS